MTNIKLNEDSQVMLLLCSHLGGSDNIKPYSLTEWNILANKLINSELKSPKAFLYYKLEEWKKLLILNDDETDRINKLLNKGSQLAFELEKLNSSGIWITTRAEKTYPILLKERLKHKCPIFLYCAGNADLFNTKAVGIVGSRNIDEKGLSFTKSISEKCVQDSYTVVSGGAKGVDSVAQDIALENNGTVISIVSDSLASRIRIREYREAIMKNKLLMVSAVHPNMNFKAYNAMARNKYIYTMSQCTVVVSSDYKKGGTWAGATENLKYNWVPMFVREEKDIPNGNLELLKIGGLSLDRASILNRNISIDSWIDKPKNSYIEKQITVDQLLVKEKLVSKTAFDIIKPFLLEQLNEEKSIDELSEIFEVKKNQMQDWLEKLTLSEDVIKKYRPVRYIKHKEVE